MSRLTTRRMSVILCDMNWRDFANADELRTLKKLDEVESKAIAARMDRKIIYNRCRKRMERASG